MQFGYDKSKISQFYDKSREMPKETTLLWLNAIAKNIPKKKIKTILDLGCGTGRFTFPLHEFFNAVVYGIDPSNRMLSKSKTKNKTKKIHFKKGQGERIPQKNHSIDLVFMAMVFHHLKNKQKTITEIKRILKSEGYIAIHQATKTDIRKMKLFSFFPKAKKIELERVPTNKTITNLFQKNDFHLIKVQKIKQKSDTTHAKYFKKIKIRGLSSLQMTPNKLFKKELSKYKEYCYSKIRKNKPVYEIISLFIFQKKRKLTNQKLN